MLQELLNLGLVDIGPDDSRFAKMEKASASLSERFKKSPELLITATLIALDEDVDEDDPFFDLVEGLAIEEWKTLRNTHVNRPRQLLRSIAISALASATSKDPELSAIVWNTAAARLVHDQTHLGKASEPLGKIFDIAFSTAEEEALRRAGLVSVAGKKQSSRNAAFSAPKALSLNGAIVSDDVFQDIARAVGPQYPQGQALNNPNPHWSNAAQHWSFEFIPRMTETLVKAVNLGTSRLAKSISESLATHISSLEEHILKQMSEVESMQMALAKSAESGHMRLDVLWWSQARYSPSQKAAYAQLPAASAALAAAADLTALVPEIAPASVTHVLGETVAACTTGEPATVMNHLAQLRNSAPDLGDVLPTGDTSKARGLLIEIVAEATRGAEVSVEYLRSRAGVDPDLILAPADFAMWLFREFQARRIARSVA